MNSPWLVIPKTHTFVFLLTENHDISGYFYVMHQTLNNIDTAITVLHTINTHI